MRESLALAPLMIVLPSLAPIEQTSPPRHHSLVMPLTSIARPPCYTWIAYACVTGFGPFDCSASTCVDEQEFIARWRFAMPPAPNDGAPLGPAPIPAACAQKSSASARLEFAIAFDAFARHARLAQRHSFGPFATGAIDSSTQPPASQKTLIYVIHVCHYSAALRRCRSYLSIHDVEGALLHIHCRFLDGFAQSRMRVTRAS